MTSTFVFGYVNPVTKEPYWQEFSFEKWADIPPRWLFKPHTIYQRSQDGTITVIKYRWGTNCTPTEEQLRQDLTDCAAGQHSAQLILPLFPAPSKGPLDTGIDSMSEMHSSWLQHRAKEDEEDI